LKIAIYLKIAPFATLPICQYHVCNLSTSEKTYFNFKKNEKFDYKWRIAALPEYINTASRTGKKL
jgi:hypothetical protein